MTLSSHGATRDPSDTRWRRVGPHRDYRVTDVSSER